MDRSPFDGDAQWIWCHGSTANPPGTPNSPFRSCHFRRTFDAPAGASLTVHVSADAEYVLYCNGQRVRHGPAKGDVKHKFYDEVVLDDHLREGENCLAAIVVNYSPSWDGGPKSRMSAVNAFVLDGVLRAAGETVETLHTDERWRVQNAEGYGHDPRPDRDRLAGANERIDGRLVPAGWTTAAFDDGDWEAATEIEKAVGHDADHRPTRLPFRMLERSIPPLEERPERFDGGYQVSGATAESVDALLDGEGSVTVDAGETASFLVDAGEVTTGYPVVDVAGGRGSVVNLAYGEALHLDGKKSPLHRPEAGEVQGHDDSYVAGGDEERYEPVSWRAFRYVAVTVEAGSDPVTLSDFWYRYTGYPLDERATFECSRDYDRLWDVTWRTVKRCSHETFEDCPYYEQLQYAGDTQPVMRFAGYVSGDWRLGRQAVRHFDWSRDETGITQSRYPTHIPQRIPSWSLLWVRMVRDYWWYTGDEATTRDVLDGVNATLAWFERRTNEAGLAEDLPHWKVVDWSPDWNDPNGVPPGANGGVSTVINLQYAAVLRDAAQVEDAIGDPDRATDYRQRATRVCDAIDEHCWDEERGVFLDRPDGDEASELGNAWAVLSGAARGERAKRVVRRFGDEDLAEAAWYGRYYLFRAASEAGVYGEVAPDLLAAYEDRLAGTDLTTFPESPNDQASYCHAWSSAPLYEFLGEVLGVDPAGPGFERVRIEPRLLDLDHAEGSVPTPRGEISVAWERDGDDFSASIETPVGVGGEVVLPDGSSEPIPAADDRLSVDGAASR